MGRRINFLKRSLIYIIAFGLSACASSGVMIDDQKLQQIKKGETTEAQVIGFLGQPTTISTSGGQRILIYAGAHVQARPASFIPVVGMLAGGGDVRSSSVVIRVQDGVVADISSSQTTIGSGTGFAAGQLIAPVQNQPR